MKEHKDSILSDALVSLASIFESEDEADIVKDEHLLWQAVSKITQFWGVELSRPVIHKAISYHDYLQDINQSTQFCTRSITLSPHWWKVDSGPLLLFDKKNKKPFAAIPQPSGGYRFYDPESRQWVSASSDFLSRMDHKGYLFYWTFQEKAVKLNDIVRFSIRQQYHDASRIVLLSIFIALMSMVIPVATGVIMDQAVPNANISLLSQILIGLFASIVGMNLFDVGKILSLMRLRFKMNTGIQAALWDRLLKLPAHFFRHYSTGDLKNRVSGMDTIQQQVTTASLETLISGLFSFLLLGLLVYYSAFLAICSLIMALVIVLFVVVSNVILLRYQRAILKLEGGLVDLTYQLISGISKLRSTNSEQRAFALWAQRFAQKSRLVWYQTRWSIHFNLIRNLLMVFVTLVLYALVGGQMVALSFGHFIAFNAAFGQFFSALLACAAVFNQLAKLVPLYERAKPLLEAKPEKLGEGMVCHSLNGKMELRDLHLRYEKNGRFMIDGISLTISPGEFVAIVGATGSGKSSLFRLMLGFETPDSGEVLYDDVDMEKLNLYRLRKQLGVVLQHGILLSGSIYEAIAGYSPLTEDMAWQAAEMACIAEDIRAMPMGMHTLISEGGRNLSVGQRQRVLIARSLAKQPKILLLDEATSALDNPTQAQIMRHLEALNITRVVSAHRLSTVKHADQIYVLDKGHVVGAGTFDALIAHNRYFKALVEQQMI